MQLEDIPRVAPPVLAVFGQNSENEALARELALDGYDVRLVSDPVQVGEVDVIVFARASRRGAGLGALRALRQGALAGSGVPVLWMSTTSDVIDTLRAFEAGADDVIRAPFVYPELLARVRALLRRPTAETPVVIRHEALTIHTRTRTVLYEATPVELRRREYVLLAYLARDPTRVFTRAELLRGVWGYPSQDATRTLDTHASRLRRKLAEAGAKGWLPSSRGVGYCLAPIQRGPRRGNLDGADSGLPKVSTTMPAEVATLLRSVVCRADRCVRGRAGGDAGEQDTRRMGARTETYKQRGSWPQCARMGRAFGTTPAGDPTGRSTDRDSGG